MVAAGWLTESDLMNGGLRNAVRHSPTAYLTDELHERAVSGRFDGEYPELRRMFRAWDQQAETRRRDAKSTTGRS